ncbi:hypothetical protein GOP47_0000315 [Adiantum capillus-veneris]|uniref:Glutaredoxin domain-containing protein n=1 Tax=Adiantum capillus-veneris TaxID=13818 RepID=A0A9D4ZS86_ADICA|nr:hypothetical protein GOP47_0000315 [Adiantum capillus-veneris]
MIHHVRTVVCGMTALEQLCVEAVVWMRMQIEGDMVQEIVFGFSLCCWSALVKGRYRKDERTGFDPLSYLITNHNSRLVVSVMGASASKRHLGNTDNDATVSRSVSFPAYYNIQPDTTDKTLWMPSNEGYIGKDMFQVGASINQAMKEGDLFVHEEKARLRSAIVNGLDHGVRERKEKSRKHRVLNSAPASPLHGATDEAWVPIWENKLKSIKVRPVDNAPNCVESGSSSFRCVESLDGNSGLKLLLSPVTTPSSRSLPASSRFANVTKNVSSSGRLDYNPTDGLDVLKNLSALDVCERESDMEGMGDSEEPGSPLFDPSILATFERAIEASSDDNWQTSEVSTSSSSRIAGSSSDICSDADSPNWPEELVIASNACGVAHPVNAAAQNPVSNTYVSSSPPFFKDSHIQKDYLEDFECKCPAGYEDKIVLYFTSLRGIRKTYENCCLVKFILKGFGVPVDARDIWMHSKFKEELTNIMGAALSVPRLFIKGRYIGGAEEVKRLHEEGILEYLVEGFPAECNSMCDFCGSVRFVPCNTCNGSCKMISIDEISRCPDCNENGLILCPSCGS